MFAWLKELKDIWNEPAPCMSCEALRVELSAERREKEMLLQHVLKPAPIAEERTVAPEPMVPTKDRHIPWKLRQQLLEADSRKRLAVIEEFKKNELAARETAKVQDSVTQDLEKELGIVEAE